MIHTGIIVDMQNDFVSPNGALSSADTQAVVPLVARYFREHRFDKLYALLDTHHADYLQTQEGQKLPVVHCIDGTWGHALNEHIQALPLNAQLCKPTFGYVDWVRFLTQEGVLGAHAANELSFTLAGVDTDICVITNALLLKSFFPEAEINVLQSLCAGTTPAAHAAALAVMQSCQINIL
ncbi:MAG: isochorismatase family protein [Paludibacteraceae bacterium]|nr:isochorismatase family protein [Paludibacteraceae bacterium]